MSDIKQTVASTNRRSKLYFICDILGNISTISLKLSAAVVVMAMIYPFYLTFFRPITMYNRFLEGHCPQLPLEAGEFIDRPNEMAKLLSILNTTSKSGHYTLVVGEHGVGKSVLVAKACSQMRSGVILVSVGYDVKTFGRQFGNSIGFNFDEEVTPLSVIYKSIGITTRFELKADEPMASFFRMAPFLISAAKTYKEWQKRTPVVIIDNVNRLSAPDLVDLQRFAKDCSDAKTLVVVFVTSEFNVLRVFQSGSEWSRMAGMIEIGDLDDEQAIKYLVRECSIPINEATMIVTNITGGRFSLLKVARNTFAETKAQIFRDIRRQFKEAGLLDRHSHVAWKAIRAILSSVSGRISLEDFEDFVPRDEENRLLKNKIFSAHVVDEEISLHSRAMAFFAMEYLENHKDIIKP